MERVCISWVKQTRLSLSLSAPPFVCMKVTRKQPDECACLFPAAFDLFNGIIICHELGSKELSGGCACKWYVNHDIPEINIFRSRWGPRSIHTAFVFSISIPYEQNSDKIGIDLGSCGGVGLKGDVAGAASWAHALAHPLYVQFLVSLQNKYF